MSSSEGENFDFNYISGSDSEDYSPVKKPKASAKPKALKASAKPKSAAAKSAAQPKGLARKKVLADHDDNGESSGMDVDDRHTSHDDEPVRKAGPSKKKTASETYTKLSQLEHILKRPDSYIGSVETITQAMWTFDSNTKRMVHRDVRYVPGFFKIVDEILVNAADNKINDPSMDTIKITIDVDECTISVYNNGHGIPVEIHSQEKIYIPELIFGHLLSSSNYDDDEKKLTGGRNGYGAKLANIYSHEFTIETADKANKLKYKQTWTNNMGVCGKPKITSNAKGEEWTRVSFRPDLQRFGMSRIDEDTAGLLRKRVYDLAGTVKDVKVYLNDDRLKIRNFKQYIEMYLNSAQAEAAENSGGAAQPKPTLIYEQIGDRWEIAFAVSEGTFQAVSFANSISTSKGGTHVNYIADQIAKNLIGSITKKNKGAAVKPAQIKNHMWLFINTLIENPTFDSQTKETLTLPAGKFGTKPSLSEDFMKKVQKSTIVDNILNWARFKADQEIKKTDGNRRHRLLGLTKLSDANNAGTKHGRDCTLILTEGDSAKALAVAGLGVVGRDNFGVFPLRGKMLNVREAKHEQIMKNEEIQNIKKIMGLQHNKDYSSTATLRYGRLMIMADQDHDGSHIKGLLINFLDHFYPSLLRLPEFLVEFVTPIVRVTKGKQRKDFFTLPEYEQWLQETPDAHKWDSKYFKGLGTSSDADARDYFSHMSKHMIPFAPVQDGDKELIDLAFSKKRADERKEWLRQFRPGTYLDHRLEEIPYSEFINKELILFSMADNIRSIPSVADGLKPGQRKVIWACFKRKLKKEIKVAQLVGYIGEQAAYHHGEVSLAQTIVGLAQNFVGSNNLSLLKPNGQYGTRETGGKNHASPRYIHTEPSKISRIIFNIADDALLTEQKEDNQVIEPEWYMPVVPMVLINGAEGIGTGWSTNIPCYNPVDIVANLRRLMAGEELVPMMPWWRGFKGEIKLIAKNKYDVSGIVHKIDDTTLEVTELPIHMWTEKFKADLESMIAKGEKGDSKDGSIKDYKEHHDNTNVHFVITMSAKELEKAEQQGLLEYFGLITKLSTSNMTCFDFDGKIKKYETPEEIVEDFYPMRLAYYQKRKDHLANEIQNALDKLNNQARFIQMIVDKQIVVSNRRKVDIIADLKKHQFKSFPKVSKAKAAGETEEADEEDEEDVEGAGSKGGKAADDNGGYDYLLGMAIWSLTRERIEKLKNQATDKENELMLLLEKSPKDLWNTDLDEFLKAWELDCEEWLNAQVQDGKGKKAKRKQAVLKTRKSIGKGRRGSDDDDDDDFKPIKASSGNATRKKAANASPSNGGTQKPAPAKKGKEKDSDVDVEKRTSAPKRKAAAKVPIKDFDEDEDGGKDDTKSKGSKAQAKDSDDDVDEVTALPSRSKSRIKEKSKPKSDSESDDDDDIVIPKPKAAVKSRIKETQKRKSPMADSDDSDELYTKPASKKTKPTMVTTGHFKKAEGSKSKITQKMKPASPPKAKPKPKAKPMVVSDSDDELDGMDYAIGATSRPLERAKRGAATAAKKYVEVSSSEEEEDGGDTSIFVDDD